MFNIVEVGKGMYQLEYTNYSNPQEKIYTPACPVNKKKIMKLKKKKEKFLREYMKFSKIYDKGI